jgi:tetratricopeptide (TPR) repeat protein
MLRGARSLFLNRPDLALKQFAKVTPTGPIRLPMLILAGEALYRVGQLPEAENCLQQAIIDAPDNIHAQRWLATVYYDLGRMDRALFYLNEVSRIEPRDFRPHRMRGVIYNDFREYDLALKAFQQSADLAVLPSDQMQVLVSLASVYIARKEFQNAMRELDRCGDSAIVLATKAECCWNLGDPDQAEILLSQAEGLGAVPAAGRRLQGRILIEKQKPAEAIAVLQKVRSDDPSDDECEYLLAMSYRLLNDNAKYKEHLQQSEKLKALKLELTSLSQMAMDQPSNSQVREKMAEVCDQLGLPQMAKLWRTAAAACMRNPGHDITNP